MHITIVAPYDPMPTAEGAHTGFFGGVERVIQEFAQRLVKRGHDLRIICSTSGPTTRHEEGKTEFIRVHRSGTLFRDPIVDLAQHVTDDTDVVHVAATYPHTTPRVLKRTKALDIPSVLDFHFEPYPAGAAAKLAVAGWRQIGPRNYRYADLALIRSRAYGETAPSLAHVPQDRWRILPNGIDPERFNANGPSRPGDYLLFVGRLVPYKGLSVLLDALARDPPGLPLIIAGDGPLRERLEAQARRLRIDVEFRGRVDDEDLPELYRRARVTLLPSVSQQEAFGIALLESMACGTPVVASDLPGVADVARNGGIVTPPRDAAQLAQAIKRAQRPGTLPRGSRLATKIHEKYAWGTLTARLVRAYEEARGMPAPEDEVIHNADPRGDPLLHA